MPKRVLYVEDNANTAMALKAMLQLKGYSVETAASVKEAADALAREKFDVVISDISLPDGQGWDVLKHSQGVKSIAISGYTADKDKQNALSKGFSSFITKPFATQHLIEEIERA